MGWVLTGDDFFVQDYIPVVHLRVKLYGQVLLSHDGR